MHGAGPGADWTRHRYSRTRPAPADRRTGRSLPRLEPARRRPSAPQPCLSGAATHHHQDRAPRTARRPVAGGMPRARLRPDAHRPPSRRLPPSAGRPRLRRADQPSHHPGTGDPALCRTPPQCADRLGDLRPQAADPTNTGGSAGRRRFGDRCGGRARRHRRHRDRRRRPHLVRDRTTRRRRRCHHRGEREHRHHLLHAPFPAAARGGGTSLKGSGHWRPGLPEVRSVPRRQRLLLNHHLRARGRARTAQGHGEPRGLPSHLRSHPRPCPVDRPRDL